MNETDEDALTSDSLHIDSPLVDSPLRDSLYVVGIGASAGGLKSLEVMVETLKPLPNCCYVVIQHLSPNYESQLAEILSRRTELPVLQVESDRRLAAGTIFVAPPSKRLAILGDRFLIAEQDSFGIPMPIDEFLQSMAIQYGRRSIAVIVSGTGADGTRGSSAVASAEGLVIVESPDSARFGGMPQSVIDAGLSHLVLDPPAIADAITQYVTSGHSVKRGTATEMAVGNGSAIDRLVALIKLDGGIDFASYKPTMMLRRINRRMGLCRLDSIDEYVQFVQRNPNELRSLGKDFLIRVTSFFRDPEVFEALRRIHLRALIESLPQEQRLRVWVAGCATGEEAYSLAILIDEIFAELQRPRNAIVYATDLDEASLKVARRGVYPSETLGPITPERRQEYFEISEGLATIKENLRSMVAFSKHDLIANQPFQNLHMVSCRNLLIYLQRTVQKQLLALLLFSLKSQGILVLGTSESIVDDLDGLETLDGLLCIFRKQQPNLLRVRQKDLGNLNGVNEASRMESVPEVDRAEPTSLAEPDERVAFLERQLRVAREELQATVEELETANEELQASNQELRASNEELQNINEEFQSVNEELYTVNVNHQIKITELETANRDINHLLRSTGVGVIFLDAQARIRKLTPRATELFGLQEEHVGRPLSSIEHPLFPHNLEDLLEEVRTSTVGVDHEFRTSAGQSYLFRILPYDAVESEHDGEQALVISIIDISEIKTAIHRAEESEQALESVLSSFTEPIIVLNRSWQYTFVNDAFCQQFGLARETILGQDIKEIFDGFRGSAFEQQFLLAFETGETVRYEERYPANDRWYRGFCFPSKDRLTVFFSDITDERQTRSLVEEQGEMLEASHDAILAWTADRGIVFWNRGAELLYGFSKQEVLGKTTTEVLHAEYPSSLEEVIESVRTVGDWEGTVIHRTSQDQILRVVSRHQIMKRDDGSEMILEVNRDITDFELLSRQVSQLASIADLTTDFVGTAESDGQTVFVNRGGAHLLGFESPEELRATTIEDLHPPETVQRLKHEAYPVIATGEVWQGETEMISRTGERIPVSQVVMAHFDPSGNATHISTIARDISEQKQYELQLEEMRNAAEAANRAKSAFLAQMSHEIRTPMTAIVGCAEQLEQSLRDANNRQLSRVMVEQGQALMAILDDILDLSRIEADKLEMESRPTDIPRVLRDLHRLMKTRADETGVDFHFELEGKFPRKTSTDPVRLRQVIVNLLSNAFKFTSEGAVMLSASCAAAAGRWELQISVADSGVGIASDQLEEIFGAFSRISNPSINAPGTGLGLTIAHRLVERLGGEIEVESDLGVGTRFRIRLPIPSPEETEYWTPNWQPPEPLNATNKSSSAQPTKLPLHILVAEDTDAIRFLLGKILGKLVAKLTMVEDGSLAVDKVASPGTDPPVDLILMDMQMPVMSGVEATRKIRRIGIQTPIVALTAGAMDADRKQCLQAGCDEFLTKPIDRQRLVNLIERIAAQ